MKPAWSLRICFAQLKDKARWVYGNGKTTQNRQIALKNRAHVHKTYNSTTYTNRVGSGSGIFAGAGHK
tara:strand:- start:6285 stop:6488 length:204 start_codon:yes stop_codon:yes gene_type:complete